MQPETSARSNQRLRTRKALLQAAAELLRGGQKPSLDEIAAQALVSRATAYRYFPNVDALLAEAAVDLAVPGATELFSGLEDADVLVRLERVDGVLHDAVNDNEAAIRMMLAASMQHAIDQSGRSELPERQNRRLPLIEAALAPAKGDFTPARRRTLALALALLMGTEGVIVIKDVLRLDDAEARRVKRWAIRTLVAGARTRPCPDGATR